MSSIGNSGARSSGPTGWSVPGCSGGGGGAGRLGITLYHWRGISDSSSVILVRSVTNSSGLRGGTFFPNLTLLVGGATPRNPPLQGGFHPPPDPPLGGFHPPRTPLAPLTGGRSHLAGGQATRVLTAEVSSVTAFLASAKYMLVLGL